MIITYRLDVAICRQYHIPHLNQMGCLVARAAQAHEADVRRRPPLCIVGMQSSRPAVVTCSVILGATAVGKVYGLIHGSGLLLQPHPFLPGTFKSLMCLGLFMELAAFAVLVRSGARLFLSMCLGLAIVFVAYHAVQVGMGIPGPCPCLGGLWGHWEPLAKAETLLAFVSACGLGVVAFLGLFPVVAPSPPPPSPQPCALSVAICMGLWLLFGIAVIWLWQGRVLGGDEGMEAAKAMQLVHNPGGWIRVWNDQPPVLSWLGAFAFQAVAPVISVGRVVVVLLGLSLPLVLAAYQSQLGLRWSAPVSVTLLWLALPSAWSSFMQEAPAYALAIASLLPLLRHSEKASLLLVSAVIAALALSFKLTAAFGLVVPFVWLLQRSVARALFWGLFAVAVMMLGSWILPHWSWKTMIASHLQSGTEANLAYRVDPSAYAYSWLLCVLTLVTVGGRYVHSRLSPVVPWIAAAVVALFVHSFHRPYFKYYELHLLAPLAVLGGIGCVELLDWIGAGLSSRRARLVTIVGVTLVSALWGWQRIDQISVDRQLSKRFVPSDIVERLQLVRDQGEAAFSMDPIWTFAAGMVQTPPELTVISLKRIWSGQMNHSCISEQLASNHLGAIVLLHELTMHPGWSNVLSGYAPAGRWGKEIVFTRKDLRFTPIDLSEQTQPFRRLGL